MNNKTSRPSKRNGLSLLESLIAFTLLAIILIPILSVLMVGNRGVQMTERELAAHHAGTELMEQFMSIPARFLPVGTFDDSMIADSLPIGSGSEFRFHISSVPGVQRKVKISEPTGTGRLKLKNIEVSILFNENHSTSVTREICFKTAVANE